MMMTMSQTGDVSIFFTTATAAILDFQNFVNQLRGQICITVLNFVVMGQKLFVY